jgi:PIN domain nuclease of toxin-antitoxin system
MEFLLDTHIIMWTVFSPERISEKTKAILTNPENKFYYSVASMWEVAIKHRKHPKAIQHSGVEFMHYCEAMGFKKLPIDDRHVCALETLQEKEGFKGHDDPFDRLLLAQAKGDAMTLLTHDSKFSLYDEPYVYLV